jgi:hypothetical protein
MKGSRTNVYEQGEKTRPVLFQLVLVILLVLGGIPHLAQAFITCPSDYQCIPHYDAVNRWGQANIREYSNEACGGGGIDYEPYYCYRGPVVATTQVAHTTRAVHYTPTPAPHYTVEITSSPEGAQLTVDSKIWGITPVTITLEQSGYHQILLQKVGYRDYSATILIPGETHLVYTLIPGEMTPTGVQTPHPPTVPITVQTPVSTQQPHIPMSPLAAFIALIILVLFVSGRKRGEP